MDDPESPSIIAWCEQIVTEVLARYPDSLKRPLPVTITPIDPEVPGKDVP